VQVFVDGKDAGVFILKGRDLHVPRTAVSWRHRRSD
jgi:hypothetical protein